MKFEVSTKQIVEAAEMIRGLPGQFMTAARLAIRAFVPILVEELQRNASGRVLVGRKGDLERAIKFEYFNQGALPGARVWVDTSIAPYGRIQDQGGIIEASAGKWLRVPLSDTLNYPLRPDYSGYEDTFIWRNPKDDALFIAGMFPDGEFELLEVLKQSVKIDATHWWTEPVNRMAPQFISFVLDQMDILFEKEEAKFNRKR